MVPRGLDLTPSGQWGTEGFPECLSLQSANRDSNDGAILRRALSEIAAVLDAFRKIAKSVY